MPLKSTDVRSDDMIPKDPSDININTNPPAVLEVEEYFLKQKLKDRKPGDSASSLEDAEKPVEQ